MNVQEYKRVREERLRAEKIYRQRCMRCRNPQRTCYCAELAPFVSNPRFVILIHRDEARRTIATGRMAHLSLKNSGFFEGTDFSDHPEVNAILQDPNNHPVVLYPNLRAVNLSRKTPAERRALFPEGKQLVVFVLDATWGQAKRIKRLSRNLSSLPMICFTPPKLSGFLVRKQPHDGCYSTIEAIHHLIELVGEPETDQHHGLIHTFTHMVRLQLDFEKNWR